MKPRLPSITVVGLFAVALVVWLVFRSHFSPSGEGVSPRAVPVGTQATSAQTTAPLPSVATVDATPAAPSPQSSVAALARGTPLAATMRTAPAPTASDPDAARADAASIDAIKVRRMVTDYHTLTGENPVGTNAEIMAALMGKNPRQAVLGPPDGVSLNSKGELVDGWGTPYFFHQLSRDVMEIHSAGPDKIMGTADDIVVR